MLQLAIKAQCCSTPVNADGFGICWYIPDVHVPGVFKDITPGTLFVQFKYYTFLFPFVLIYLVFIDTSLIVYFSVEQP
jgi:hypothetical protein